jgi:hypothetical protein
VLACKRDLSATALVLLHAGDAMITGLIKLDFAVAGIDRQPLLIAEKCVARLILTAGGVRMFAKFLWPPALWRIHGRHWFHFRHGFHTFQSEPSLSEKFSAFGYARNVFAKNSTVRDQASFGTPQERQYYEKARGLGTSKSHFRQVCQSFQID